MRWIIPAGLVPTSGAVVGAPGPLSDLIQGETLSSVVLDGDAIRTRLAEGLSWSTCGPEIRSALHEALTQPGGWRIATDGAAELVGDDRLRAVVADVIDGPVGQLITSHGGRVEVVSVRDGVVEVSLSGACSGCPAARATLHNRLEHAIRAVYPDLVTVRRR